MLVSRNHDLIKRAKFLATQARESEPHYEHKTYGYNYRLSNVSAAIGIGQLAVLDERVQRRREIGERYQNAFAEFDGVAFMPEPEASWSTRWLSIATFDPKICGVDRETIRLALLKHQIESRPLWKPMHMQPLFKGVRYIGRGLDEHLFDHGLCLPSGSDMTDAEQSEVISRICTVLIKNGAN